MDNFVTTLRERLRDAGPLFVAIAVQVFAEARRPIDGGARTRASKYDK
jgi:hypothetical protein